MITEINRIDGLEKVKIDGRKKAPKAESLAAKRKRLLTERLNTQEAAKLARKNQVDSLRKANAKERKAECEAVENQTSTGDLNMKYVLPDTSKVEIKAAFDKRVTKLSKQENKVKLSGLILNPKTEIQKAVLKELKTGERLNVQAFIPA